MSAGKKPAGSWRWSYRTCDADTAESMGSVNNDHLLKVDLCLDKIMNDPRMSSIHTDSPRSISTGKGSQACCNIMVTVMKYM